MTMATIFETERLVVEPLATDRDELFIFELLNEPGFLENIGDRGANDLDGARAYIEKVLAGYGENGFGLWRVTEKAGGAPVGICGLVKRNGLEDLDVGYAFLERSWGQGYAAEAAGATLDHARKALGLGRIVAIVAPGNIGSIRVLEKIGLRYEGRIHLPDHGGESAYFISDPPA